MDGRGLLRSSVGASIAEVKHQTPQVWGRGQRCLHRQAGENNEISGRKRRMNTLSLKYKGRGLQHHPRG